MSTETLLRELEKLPLTERMLVVEKTLKTIRQEKSEALLNAAELLYDDYKNDKELTIFTELDAADFYEAK